MKKARKLIAAIAAATMVLTSFVGVSAMTSDTGIRYRNAFYNKNSGSTISPGTYYCGDRSNAYYKVFEYSGKYDSCELANSEYTSGTWSMRMQGWSCNDGNRQNGGARLTIYFGTESYNHYYNIKFNVKRSDADWRDYVALNGGNWNSTARLSGETQWNEVGIGNGWEQCTARLNTGADDPQLDFVAYANTTWYIDDIEVTDDQGRLIFSEDFEKDEPSSTLTNRWTYAGTADAAEFRIVSDLKSESTNHSLHVKGKNNGVAYVTIQVPKVKNNQYTLTYDTMAALNGDYIRDVSIDFAGNNIYGTYRIPSSATTSHSVSINSSGNTGLKIAATGWASVRIDNIRLTDSEGKTVFFEDFEEHDREFSVPLLTIGGVSRYQIDATGTATITASAGNNKENSAFNVYLIAAVYDSTGKKLERFVYDNASLSKNTRKDFSLSVDVTSGQKLSLFWWDSLTGSIKPVEDSDGTSIKKWSY